MAPKTKRSPVAARRALTAKTPTVKGRAARARRLPSVDAAREPAGPPVEFTQQLDRVWGRLASSCQQFADGFNGEMGLEQMRVHAGQTSLQVRFATTDAEVMFQLDRERGHLECWVNSGCSSVGSCIIDQPPVALGLEGDEVRIVYAGSPVSEEDLAVMLLTGMSVGQGPA